MMFGLALAALGGTTLKGVSAAPATQPTAFPAGTRVTGYKLGLLATACWMGSAWSDAEGAPVGEWAARDEQRCRDLVVSIYGRFDQFRYDQLRANESRSVGDLLAKIRATESLALRDRTAALFRDVAAAVQEGMLARRAADRVKIDYDADAAEVKLTADERTAAKVLARYGALERLVVTPDAGTADRRVLGLLLSLDRIEMARGLPKQLKFYAVGRVLTTVFGTPPPSATALNPTATPQPGTWLAYLSGAATLAGHPVSDSPALPQKTRETLAWTGVGVGFAERLRREASSLPNAAVPELSRIATSFATRLETQRATAEAMGGPHAQKGAAQ
jgi:hypothetical protein